MRRTRSSLAMAVVCFLIAVIATSVSAGAPVDRYMKHDKSSSRDIVLCLDASGSMLPYDSKIGDSFKQIISHFEGERISLQLWNAYSMTMFPLTDDYEMANDVLTEMAEKIDRGFTQVGNKIYFTEELDAYLKPTLSGPDDRRGSLVGDGLASCVLGFDHTDKKRSRTILLATDNEVVRRGHLQPRRIYRVREEPGRDRLGSLSGLLVRTQGRGRRAARPGQVHRRRLLRRLVPFRGR